MRFDSKTTITWMGGVMGLTLVIFGILVGGVLLASPSMITPTSIQHAPTHIEFPFTPTPYTTPTAIIVELTPTLPLSTATLEPTVTADELVVITYTVRSGDTLSSIALKYDITADDLKAANPTIISETIFPSQTLIISNLATIPPEVMATHPPSETDSIVYTVGDTDTLWDISMRYSVSIEAIKAANDLTDDFIRPGDTLLIPSGEYSVTSPVTQTISQVWYPSIIEGNLSTGYPLSIDMERFTLHYQPNTLPAQNIDQVLEMVTAALTHIENTLKVHLDGRFDAYAAGSLFAAPNLSLRGRSFSSQRRFLFLYDGSGSPADQQYILTHELTHVTTWNTMGAPSSVMLHEGVAVYTGMEQVKNKGYIPLDLFCAAYYHLGQLPSISASPAFEGHIRDLDNYYTAGCFVGFLIEKYGADNFATVYHTGDYQNTYGKSITELESEWITTIQDTQSFPFDPDDLIYYVDEVAKAYDLLFSDFEGTEHDMAAYEKLDQARMALLQGNLNDTGYYLSAFADILNE